MPPAARIGDPTMCPMQTPTPAGPVPHVGTPLIGAPPMPPVMIGGMPAATMGCQCICAGPAPIPNPYPKGSLTVLIGGKPALRMGDMGSHPGSQIMAGAPTVMIGG
ncbi:MAG: hypothetical protein QOF60_2203 [Actinomycetota bacterium]|jgi:uncharacterized Zn-binding protein involved in type VI secretion|nr:hypothetical protein [Actinomycetota bacterium]